MRIASHLFFFLLRRYIHSMQVLIKFVLLSLTAVLVFINPLYIGRVLYYSLFPLLFVLVWLFYRTAYFVSEASVRKVFQESYSYSLFCALVPPVDDGDLIRGRLVFTSKSLVLFQRNPKGGGCKEVWRMDIDQIKQFTVGRVLSVRKGITFSTEEREARFVSLRGSKDKEVITAALGWKQD